MALATSDIRDLRSFRNTVAVVGIGETDYGRDYRALRDAETQGAHDPRDVTSLPYELLVRAFKRALEDSGLRKEEINGLGVNSVASDTNFERVGELLGLTITWGGERGNPDHLIQVAVDAINGGRCDTVAIVYGTATRSTGVSAYGGVQAGRTRYMNLWYYHPWGFSSPGAQYAMAFQQYLNRFGGPAEQLAAVPIAFRKHASLNENAVMRDPLTPEDYAASRYVCRPLRLFDCCLVNDGGVCVILRRVDMAQDLRSRPVLISGLGRLSPYRHHTQMAFRMIDDCWENLGGAGDQCFAMAGLSPKDVDTFQCYDGFSFQLPVNLEGFGFCEKGEGLEYVQDGRIEVGGELPCNTSGGMLSESYMHGMNHQVEAVRQLRHEAGARQVKDAATAMYCHHGHWGALSIMYQRAN